MQRALDPDAQPLFYSISELVVKGLLSVASSEVISRNRGPRYSKLLRNYPSTWVVRKFTRRLRASQPPTVASIEQESILLAVPAGANLESKSRNVGPSSMRHEMDPLQVFKVLKFSGNLRDLQARAP